MQFRQFLKTSNGGCSSQHYCVRSKWLLLGVYYFHRSTHMNRFAHKSIMRCTKKKKKKYEIALKMKLMSKNYIMRKMITSLRIVRFQFLIFIIKEENYLYVRLNFDFRFNLNNARKIKKSSFSGLYYSLIIYIYL